MTKASDKLVAMLIAFLLIVLIALTSCSQTQDTVDTTATSEGSFKKVLIVGNNLVIGDATYIPLTSQAYCDKLASLYAVTDNDLQVFTIEGHSGDKYLCLIQGGTEQLYQSRTEIPLTLNGFVTDAIVVQQASTIEDRNDHIIDMAVVQPVIDRIQAEYLAEPSDAILKYVPISLSSSKYPGIHLSYVFMHDSNDNCFLLDTGSGQTWLIGHELMEYIP